jgi:hypothetical protein
MNEIIKYWSRIGVYQFSVHTYSFILWQEKFTF